MRRYRYGVSLAAALLVWAIQPAQASHAGAFTGTWKLNVAKSTYSPGPALKSETVTIAPDDKVSVEGTNADGSTVSWSYMPAEDSPATIEGMENSTVVQKMSGNTVDHTWKMGGATQTGHGVISNDGKTLTYTMTGKNAQGQDVHDVLVFEKQ